MQLKTNQIKTIVFLLAIILSSKISCYSAPLKKDNGLATLKRIYSLYSKASLSTKEQILFYKTVEGFLGIKPNGETDNEKLIHAKEVISQNRENLRKMNIQDESPGITSISYIYLETTAFYKQREKLLSFCENTLFKKKFFFKKGKQYYRSLYFYLLNTKGELINKIQKAIALLSSKPKSVPDFTKTDILRLENIIRVSGELKRFLQLSSDSSAKGSFNYNKIFDSNEKAWVMSTTSWFTDTDNYLAIYSYEWFRKSLPKALFTALIIDKISYDWKQQSMIQRQKLPLLFFTGPDKRFQTNIDELFLKTLKYLQFNDREIDLLVTSALKSWISKQIAYGINVKDRLKYANILKELSVCPSGWVFYNLFELRKNIAELQSLSENFTTLSQKEKDNTFKNKIQPIYSKGLINLDEIFNDLTKIFGSPNIYGNQIKRSFIHPIFHTYKGELVFLYEKLFFDWVKSTGQQNLKVPATKFMEDSLLQFKAAFIKNPASKRSHEDLLKAYNLYLDELEYNGELTAIMTLKDDFMSLIENNGLGKELPGSKNNTYDIYHIFAETYLKNPGYVDNALPIAIKSFSLAKKYYISAAKKFGFFEKNKVGALNNNCTEIDDYEREYEFLQKISGKLGKKIQLIITEDEIKLYNKLIAQN